VLPPAKGGAMCEKCVEIDKMVEQYRKILMSIGDQFTIDRVRELLAELQVEKVALHPEHE
jgi:hypothetical protein